MFVFQVGAQKTREDKSAFPGPAPPDSLKYEAKSAFADIAKQAFPKDPEKAAALEQKLESLRSRANSINWKFPDENVGIMVPFDSYIRRSIPKVLALPEFSQALDNLLKTKTENLKVALDDFTNAMSPNKISLFGGVSVVRDQLKEFNDRFKK